MTPAESMSARVKVSPAFTSTLGETFQPWPRSRAASAPVPSVARPPPPTEPSKFSGLMERVCTARRLASEEWARGEQAERVTEALPGVGSSSIRSRAAGRRWANDYWDHTEPPAARQCTLRHAVADS